jgi:iron complex transport system substrate-binding protein
MKKISLSTLALLLLALITAYDDSTLEKRETQPVLKQTYQRIISLAPSITETLFALGLGEQIIGVTRYCNYPPGALTKPRIGGYLDPNVEAIMALKPDLVITFPDHHALEQKLEQVGITVRQIQHQKTLSDVLDSIHVIGKTTGKFIEAEALVKALQTRMETVKNQTAALSRPRVLVVMARPLGTPPKEVFIAGPGDPYNEMIRIAGGINAYQGQLIRVPPLSAEGIISLNPDVIIELVSRQGTQQGVDEKTILQDWTRFSKITAVKTGRIHLFADDFDTVPGPRFILTLEKMAQVIHPEIKGAVP